LLVYSKDSLQGKLVDDQNPRALYFSDRIALGWVRDGEFIEVAVHDESAGVVFYTLEQRSKTQAKNKTAGISNGLVFSSVFFLRGRPLHGRPARRAVAEPIDARPQRSAMASVLRAFVPSC
jgi:hypothetical protein